MTIGLNGRIVLVTGAARGLGLEYTKSLVRQGAFVAMHDGGVDPEGLNPDPNVIRNAAKQIDSEKVFPVAGLLNTRDDCIKLVETVFEHYGRLDALISNAGVVIWRNTTEVDEKTLRASSAINHEASFWLCQAALPIMQKQGFGRIVLTSSGWAFGPYPGSEELTLYCQSKGAQYGLGMALAHGSGHPDIKVNVTAPIADTRIYASQVEAGRLKPESVAGTVTWLVSADCDINGQVLKIADGNISVLAMSEVGTSELGEDSTDPVKCANAVRSILKTVQG